MSHADVGEFFFFGGGIVKKTQEIVRFKINPQVLRVLRELRSVLQLRASPSSGSCLFLEEISPNWL